MTTNDAAWRRFAQQHGYEVFSHSHGGLLALRISANRGTFYVYERTSGLEFIAGNMTSVSEFVWCDQAFVDWYWSANRARAYNSMLKHFGKPPLPALDPVEIARYAPPSASLSMTRTGYLEVDQRFLVQFPGDVVIVPEAAQALSELPGPLQLGVMSNNLFAELPLAALSEKLLEACLRLAGSWRTRRV